MTLPPLWALKWAGGLALVAGAFVAGHVGGVKAGTARVQARWDADRAALMARALAAEAAARAEETRRVAAVQEIARHADDLAALARADAARAAAAGAGLRQRVAAVAARCGGPASDSGAALPGPAASAPGDLLADVLGRLEAAGRELAEVADARGRAGAACEAAYEAITEPPR